MSIEVKQKGKNSHTHNVRHLAFLGCEGSQDIYIPYGVLVDSHKIEYQPHIIINYMTT